MIAPPVESGSAQAQALFQAARDRRRRRWAAALIAVAVAITAGLIALAWAGLISLADGPGPAGVRAPAAGYLGAARPAVPWVDFGGHLHLGDPESAAQRAVANIIAAPGVPLAAAGGRIYWVHTGGSFYYVQDLDLVVGDPVAWARWLPGGRQLIAGGAGRDYLIDAAARSAAALRLDRSGGGPNYSAAIVTPARVPAG
jgi:hypothetical protein